MPDTTEKNENKNLKPDWYNDSEFWEKEALLRAQRELKMQREDTKRAQRNMEKTHDLTSLLIKHVPYYIFYFVVSFIVVTLGGFIYRDRFGGYSRYQTDRHISMILSGDFAPFAVVAAIITIIAVIKDIRDFRKAEKDRIDRGLK